MLRASQKSWNGMRQTINSQGSAKGSHRMAHAAIGIESHTKREIEQQRLKRVDHHSFLRLRSFVTEKKDFYFALSLFFKPFCKILKSRREYRNHAHAKKRNHHHRDNIVDFHHRIVFLSSHASRDSHPLERAGRSRWIHDKILGTVPCSLYALHHGVAFHRPALNRPAESKYH